MYRPHRINAPFVGVGSQNKDTVGVWADRTMQNNDVVQETDAMHVCCETTGCVGLGRRGRGGGLGRVMRL